MLKNKETQDNYILALAKPHTHQKQSQQEKYERENISFFC